MSSILEAALDAIISIDLEGRVVEFNPAAEQIFGYSRAEALGQPMAELIIPSSMRERHYRGLAHYLATGEGPALGRRLELAALRADGTEFPVELAITRMSGDGLPIFTAFLRDITERKRAEQALAAERERLRVTLASIGDAVIVTDVEGRPTFLNPVAETLTGWTQADAEGRSLDEVFRIVNEHTRRPAESPVPRVLREGMVVGLANHTVLMARGGAEVAIDDSAAPIRDEAGQTAGVVLVFRDVTERRRAEETRGRLAAIVESSDLAIFSKDMEGTVTSWNRAAEALYGYSAEEMIGQPITRIIPPGQPDEFPAIMRRLGRGERIEQYETVRVRKDGRQLDVLVNISPLFDANGAVNGASVIARDITETKRNEDARRQMEEALREADRRKDDFLAMLAHELRNPLAPVRTALHLLRLQGGDAKAVERRVPAERVMAMMDRQVQHPPAARAPARLIDDLLDVSRITRGKIRLQRERLDLAQLLRVTLEDQQAAFHAAGLTLEASQPETPVWVLGDPTRLTQVLDNLLENARKFTDRGGKVGVQVFRCSGVQAGKVKDEAVLVGPEHLNTRTPEHPNTAVVTITDTGMGIEPALLPQLFDVFAQADRSLDRSGGGLGLGLALVKGLIELHGGSVEARSEGVGRGAQFILRLPLEPEPGALTAPPVAAAPGAAGRRVLIIEDNPDTAESLRLLLEAYGCAVQVAHSGPIGLEAARESRPEVVLCDIGLPGMDGYAVARALRGRPWGRELRLIAVTGYGREENARHAQEAGFDEHLVKPVDPDRLLNLLQGQ